MESARWEALLTWIGQHPIAAGAVIFLIVFFDALVIVGVAVPAVPLLFAVGTLVGLGHIDGIYAVICAAAGGFFGDGISYVVGRRYGDHLREIWPFRNHPEWLEGGERAFRKHGIKSIVIARYVGAIRPFVPAIAGMLKMPVARYTLAASLSCILWSVTFLAPGWIFGASLDLVAAVAGRLSIVIGLVLLLIVSIWAAVFYLWRWLAPQATSFVERALAWSHRHPVLGKYSEALIDPNRPESATLLFFAIALLVAGWGFFTLLISVGGGLEPSMLDLTVHQGMFGLRHPLSDPIMAFCATLGDSAVLWPAVALLFAWLLWRRRSIAAWHWLVAPLGALTLTGALGWLIDLPKPPAASAVLGFSFPSFSVTMAAVVYGFFAVLIAHELPGRRRVWPYVVAALLTGLLGFSRLYLGAHWLSDVLAGLCFGLIWTTVVGIAYRRRVLRSFWIKPAVLIFFGTVAVMAAWHGTRSASTLLAKFDPPLLRQSITSEQWMQQSLKGLPVRRNELRGRDAWPFNVQYVGKLDELSKKLGATGWQPVQTGGWTGLLQMLDRDAKPDTLAIMPAAHQGRSEALVLVHQSNDPADRLVLRLWAAPYHVDGTPLWVGTVQRLHFSTRWDFASYWSAQQDFDASLQPLISDLQDWRENNDSTLLRVWARPMQ